MIGTEELTKVIRAAIVQSRPFPHMRLTRIFCEKDYDDILRHLPSANDYEELRHKDAKQPGGAYTRLEFPLTQERLQRLPPDQCLYWSTLADALRHPDIATAFSSKFAELGCRVPIKAGSILRLVLVRDSPGYFIRPHQDIPSKLLTAQFYLPRDERGATMGTNFYRRCKAGTLERDVIVPFLPNTGYAFPVTDESWHGVDIIPPGAPVRDSLMLIWYVGGAAKLGAEFRRVLRWFRPIRHHASS